MEVLQHLGTENYAFSLSDFLGHFVPKYILENI